MASHTYSAQELLYMRQKPLREDMHRKLHARLRMDAELGDLIQPRVPSSTNGNATRFQRLSGDSGINTKNRSRQLDGTDGEWRYRGRTDSEHAEGQPIPAPSDIVVQKDEGFQRFYKAVVSPTHVRVTAGGRIVPNTRGSTSPGPKLPGERPSDSAASIRSASGLEAAQNYGFTVPPAGFSAMAQVFPGFGPAMVPAMTSVPSPYSPFPWHPGIGFGQGYPFLSGVSSLSQPAQFSHLDDVPRSDRRSDAGSIKAASIQGPSPDKPQMQPGVQWMMPPPPPFYSYPYQPPPGYHHASQPQQMVPQSSMDAVPKARSSVSKESQHSMRSAPSRAMTTPSIIGMPKSSIRPSEITRNQICALRSSLKYLEDQMLYNKHQVDEKALEQQSIILKQQIRHFEKNLDNQLIFEGNHYPTSVATKGQPPRSESSRDHIGSKASVASEESVEKPPYKQSVRPSTSLVPSLRLKTEDNKKTAFSTGINSTKSVSAFAPLKLSAKNNTHLEPLGSSTALPVTAALAAPFEPRRSDQAPSVHLATASEPERNGSERCGSMRHGTHRRAEHLPPWSSETPMIAGPLPYLVGYLPQGMSAGTARESDYMYTRPLTEDELRARHMYWGKTPRHLQKGLPKFDGKDFYPPSPTKGRSSDRETSSTYSSRRLPVGDVALDYGLDKATAESELFRSLEQRIPRATRGILGAQTQSEAVARSSRETEDTTASAAGYQRYGSCFTRVGAHDSFEDRSDVNVDVSSASLPDKSSSDEAEDDKDLLFKGRKASQPVQKTQNGEMWRSMMKKGKTSGIAAPGAVSSTTVQGVLPQYTGYATASLTPAIANSTTPPPRTVLSKPLEAGESALTQNLTERKRENMPPTVPDDAANATRRAGASFVASQR